MSPEQVPVFAAEEDPLLVLPPELGLHHRLYASAHQAAAARHQDHLLGHFLQSRVPSDLLMLRGLEVTRLGPSVQTLPLTCIKSIKCCTMILQQYAPVYEGWSTAGSGSVSVLLLCNQDFQWTVESLHEYKMKCRQAQLP